MSFASIEQLSLLNRATSLLETKVKIQETEAKKSLIQQEFIAEAIHLPMERLNALRSSDRLDVMNAGLGNLGYFEKIKFAYAFKILESKLKTDDMSELEKINPSEIYRVHVQGTYAIKAMINLVLH